MTTWTDPRTWNIGELVTKAIMDTHVRDNLKYLKEQLSTALQVTARKGGSATDWSATGTSNYTPSVAKSQTGVGSISFSASNSGNVVVTFPTAFANIPIVFVTSQYDTVAQHTFLFPRFASVSQFTVYAATASPVTGILTFSWLAIGEMS